MDTAKFWRMLFGIQRELGAPSESESVIQSNSDLRLHYTLRTHQVHRNYSPTARLTRSDISCSRTRAFSPFFGTASIDNRLSLDATAVIESIVRIRADATSQSQVRI